MISEATEAARVRQAKIDASPKREDFEREFGKQRIKNEADGSWSLSLHYRADIRKAHEMQEGTRKLDVDRGYELHSRVPRQRVVRRDGRVIEVAEEGEHAAKRNIRPLGRGGVSACERFSMADSYGRYEQGPDGLWFVWNDGWEPTALWEKPEYRGTRQHDPDGNVWLMHEEDWALESEVG